MNNEISRLDAVRKLANQIITAHSYSPPIDIVQLIDALGISIAYENNDSSIEAYTELGVKNCIHINRAVTSSNLRLRFTLAHELGHVIIPWHNGVINSRVDDGLFLINGKKLLDTQELEANVFASNILMPPQWIRGIINSKKNASFEELIDTVSSEAKTSVLASLYALENELPSGLLYYVKKKSSDWINYFCSKRTYTLNWFKLMSDAIDFIERVCISKEMIERADYDIVAYRMLPCPSKEELRNNYYVQYAEDLEELLNGISNNHRLRCMPFLDIILDDICDGNYLVYVFENGRTVARKCSEGSSLLNYIQLSINPDELLHLLEKSKIDHKYCSVSDDYCVVIIRETEFEPEGNCFSDPNALLKEIVDDLGYSKHQLQSINGIVAGFNSNCKTASVKDLYNKCMYRMISDVKLVEFVNHPHFRDYLLSKIISIKY